MTYQKTIGKPLVQLKCTIGNEAPSRGVDVRFVSERSRECRAGDLRKVSVVCISGGLAVKAHCSCHRHKKEHGYSVGHE